MTDKHQPTKGYRTFVLMLLTVVYGFNFIDRQIVGILAPFIQEDLNLTNTYDFICASYVLHYSKELDKTLTNIIQLLNPQGILIISVPNPKQFKQGENQLFLGDNEMKTRFYNHSQTAYLVTLKTFGTVVKTKENEDVFIVKFQKA